MGFCAAAAHGPAGDRFALVVGGNCGPVERQVRDHPGHRYATGARFGAAVCGCAMAHPLNRARYDEDRSACRCWATASCSHGWRRACPARTARGMRACAPVSPGIDPYTRAVSDVYQDLFGEGSFIGKGIYEVETFQRALGGRFPRQPDPQPRSSGRLLRAGRTIERCGGTRGIPLSLQRGCEPPVSLDSRRLADCALAVAMGSRPRWRPAEKIRYRCFRAGRSSTTCGAVSPRRR